MASSRKSSRRSSRKVKRGKNNAHSNKRKKKTSKKSTLTKRLRCRTSKRISSSNRRKYTTKRKKSRTKHRRTKTKTNTKMIAFYLPQFHRIPENDAWWGEGFTEWTNTRKAQPLFSGHYQPKEPYHDHYYDLTDPAARKWQADLARKYGIYGFCYYHYWFNGKLLLETPMHEMLRTGEPDFPFCLSWANEPWTRAWDGMNQDVLMPQDYGDEHHWKEHFDYLFPIFSDKRYIRVAGKPLFIIYRPANITRCDEMLKYWNDLAIANGLAGIYFVETLSGFALSDKKGFHASIEFEPMYTSAHNIPIPEVYKEVDASDMNFKLRLFKYRSVWERILKRKRKRKRSGKQTFLGAFVDFDNSARRGYYAYIYDGASPRRFGKYVQKQLSKANRMGSEFLFINAWNEWAEGAYLEPDKKHGLGYLKELKKAFEKSKQY